MTPTVDVATLLDRSRDWVSYHRRRLGIGTYIGRVWMFSDDEIEQLRQILEGGDDPALIRARVLALHRAGVRRAAIAAHYDVDSRTISPVPYTAWHTFAPFHYLTQELNNAARCYALFVGGRIAAFAGILHRPHANAHDIKGVSRLVTLPDWQGLGLAFVLVDTLGAAHKAIGNRLHTYPAHPSLIRAFDRSPVWAMRKKPGTFSHRSPQLRTGGMFKGGRASAVFAYVGPAMEHADAAQLLGRDEA